LAAGIEHETVMQLLLANESVDPNFKNEKDRMPLSLAISIGHEAIMKLLLAKDSVDPNSKNKNNRTPL
jgi:ankyrin repeat protein